MLRNFKSFQVFLVGFFLNWMLKLNDVILRIMLQLLQQVSLECSVLIRLQFLCIYIL